MADKEKLDLEAQNRILLDIIKDQEKTNASLEATLGRVKGKAEIAAKEAYASGYSGGHNDTVEGVYWDIDTERAQEFYDESRCDNASAIKELDSILFTAPQVLAVAEIRSITQNEFICLLEAELPMWFFNENIGDILVMEKEASRG